MNSSQHALSECEAKVHIAGPELAACHNFSDSINYSWVSDKWICFLDQHRQQSYFYMKMEHIGSALAQAVCTMWASIQVPYVNIQTRIHSGKTKCKNDKKKPTKKQLTFIQTVSSGSVSLGKFWLLVLKFSPWNLSNWQITIPNTKEDKFIYTFSMGRVKIINKTHKVSFFFKFTYFIQIFLKREILVWYNLINELYVFRNNNKKTKQKQNDSSPS